MSNVIQYMNGRWLKRTFKDEEELGIAVLLSTTSPYEKVEFETYSADPYSDDYSNFYLEEAREAREQAEYEEYESAMFLHELAEGGSDLNDPNHYDDDGRFHLISRSEMGYED